MHVCSLPNLIFVGWGGLYLSEEIVRYLKRSKYSYLSKNKIFNRNCIHFCKDKKKKKIVIKL